MTTIDENKLPLESTPLISWYVRYVTARNTGKSVNVLASSIKWLISNVDGLQAALDAKATKATKVSSLAFAKSTGNIDGSGIEAKTITLASQLDTSFCGFYNVNGEVYTEEFGFLYSVIAQDDTIIGESPSGTTTRATQIIYSDRGVYSRVYISGSWGAGRFMGASTFSQSKTRAELEAMITAQQLQPGYIYKYYDHENDQALLLEASTNNTFYSEGVRLGLVPRHYIAGSFNGHTWLGVFHAGLTPNFGDYCVYCGRVWRNTSGNLGAVSGFDLDSNWTLEPVLYGDFYDSMFFGVEYDFELNYISYQWNSDNKLGENYADVSDGFKVEYNDWNINADGKCLFVNNELLRFYKTRIDTSGINFVQNNKGRGVVSDCYIFGTFSNNTLESEGTEISFTNPSLSIISNNLINGVLKGSIKEFKYNTIINSTINTAITSVTYSEFKNSSITSCVNTKIEYSIFLNCVFSNKTFTGKLIHSHLSVNDETPETYLVDTQIRDDLKPKITDKISLGDSTHRIKESHLLELKIYNSTDPTKYISLKTDEGGNAYFDGNLYATGSNAAYGLGTSGGGGLTEESDPIFMAHAASGITATKINHWDAAYTHSQIVGGTGVHISDTERTNWGTAYTHSQNTTTSVHGATTLGYNLLKITNPSAITFPRFNADNSVSSLSASDFRTAIGLAIGTDVQAYDADLASIAALTGIGLLERTDVNTWSINTNNYATTGDLSNHAGLTTTAHGLGGSAFHDSDYYYRATNPNSYVSLSDLTGVFQPYDADLNAISGLTGTGLLRKTAVNTWSLDSTLDKFNDMFTLLGSGTELDPYKIQANYAFYSLYSNAAYGLGTSGGGGLTEESDPIFVASPAHGITSTKITNWDAAYTFVTNGGSLSADFNADVMTANSFVKVGGTASQFLKANGSLDSTVYEPTLGNPSVDGYLLSSNTAGARSWVAPYSHPDYSIETGIGGTLGHIKASERTKWNETSSLFTLLGSGTELDPYKIQANYAFYSLYSNAAYGLGISGGGGGAVVNLLTSSSLGGEFIDDTSSADTFNAYTINAINNRFANYVPTSLIGSINGVAELDENGKVLASQLPLGETSSTAYRGDRGATAYADRFKWDGGSTGLDAATGRASLGLGSAALKSDTYFALLGGSSSQDFNASSFIKSGSSNSYVLLGGGGHIALPDLKYQSGVSDIRAIPNDLYTFFSSSAFPSNSPIPGATWVQGIQFALAGNSDYRNVLCTSGDQNLYLSGSYNGIWGDWVKFYHSGNSNLSTVPWSVSTLTASSFIQATTAKFTTLHNGYLPYVTADGLVDSGVYYSGGNVGNFNNPQTGLHLTGNFIDSRTVGGNYKHSIRLTDPYSTNFGGGGELQFGLEVLETNSVLSAIKGTYSAYSAESLGGSLNFYTQNTGTLGLIERMTILHSGNVGIGYSSGTEISSYKLAVNGSGLYNGNLTLSSATNTFLQIGGARIVWDGTALKVVGTDGTTPVSFYATGSNAAYGIGTSGGGGLTEESDPIFTAHAAYGITATKITNWDAAYTFVTNGGSLSADFNADILTANSFVKVGGTGANILLDNGTTVAKTSYEAAGTMTTHTTTYNHGDFVTAYNWGNHASAGYLLASTASTTYEPIITKSTGFLKWSGTAWVWDTSTYITGTPWTSEGYLTAATLPVASDSVAGIVSTTTQIFTGGKIFIGGITSTDLMPESSGNNYIGEDENRWTNLYCTNGDFSTSLTVGGTDVSLDGHTHNYWTETDATTSVKGIMTLGAAGGAATYGHNHDTVYAYQNGDPDISFYTYTLIAHDIEEGGVALASKYAAIDHSHTSLTSGLSVSKSTGTIFNVLSGTTSKLNVTSSAITASVDIDARYNAISCSQLNEAGTILAEKYAAIADKFPGFGTTGTTAAYGNHDHSGIYATAGHNHNTTYAALAGLASQSFACSTLSFANLFISALNTPPASSGATGTEGEIRICWNGIYVCIGEDTWVKATLSSW